jgi:putrescine transport system ATP-binding protein
MTSLSKAQILDRLHHPWNDPTETPFIRIQGVSKAFDGGMVLDDVDLTIYKKEFFSLLGPSGSGKTTLLRMLAGFERPDRGRIHIGAIDVTQTPPHRLPVNMVFQSYALFPHMTIGANIAFELKRLRWSPKAIRDRVAEMLDLVHLQGYDHRYPHSLSGGQKQRVALARALAGAPEVLLLDEPLGSLDKKLREKTQFELVNIQEKVGATFIMVTHDQEEAMTMSTRMAILEHGGIRQVGTPGEVYEYPNSVSVAHFVGSMNIFEGVVTDVVDQSALVQSDALDVPLKVGNTSAVSVGMPVSVAVRPEKVMVAEVPVPQVSYNGALGTVVDIAYLGDMSIYHIELESGAMVTASQPNILRLAERALTWDSKVFVHWTPGNSLLLTQ